MQPKITKSSKAPLEPSANPTFDQGVQQFLSQGFQQMNQGFQQMNQGFQQMDQRFGEMNRAILKNQQETNEVLKTISTLLNQNNENQDRMIKDLIEVLEEVKSPLTTTTANPFADEWWNQFG